MPVQRKEAHKKSGRILNHGDCDVCMHEEGGEGAVYTATGVSASTTPSSMKM